MFYKLNNDLENLNNAGNSVGSEDISEKIYLVGTKQQAESSLSYSHDTVYIGDDGHVYSNGKQVINLSDEQALTNKTYEGFTLAKGCSKDVTDNSIPSAILNTDESILTGRSIYYGLPTINNNHDYTSETNIYAPTSVGTNGYLLQSSGVGEPKWFDPSKLDISGNSIFDNYAQKEYVIKAVMDAMKDIVQFDYEIVETLPETGVAGKLYLLLNSGTESNNLFDKYMWVEETSSFEILGANTTITNFVPIPVAEGNLAVIDENGKIADSGLKFKVEDGVLKIVYDDGN